MDVVTPPPFRVELCDAARREPGMTVFYVRPGGVADREKSMARALEGRFTEKPSRSWVTNVPSLPRKRFSKNWMT